MTEENKKRLEMLARANAWLVDDYDSFICSSAGEDVDVIEDGMKTIELIQELIDNEAKRICGAEINLWDLYTGELKL